MPTIGPTDCKGSCWWMGRLETALTKEAQMLFIHIKHAGVLQGHQRQRQDRIKRTWLEKKEVL